MRAPVDVGAESAERARLAGLYKFQENLVAGRLAVGLDEVGRGSVAGPLAVGAVILPSEPQIEGLNDSKKIPEKKRVVIAEAIKQVALAWAVEFIEADAVDACGITASLRMAFLRALCAVEAFGMIPEAVLLDGYAMQLDERELNVVKGDSKCASIAAASVVAKVERDALMREYAKEFPAYRFESNKGYASAAHIAAIREYGLSPIHRRSFCGNFLRPS